MITKQEKAAKEPWLIWKVRSRCWIAVRWYPGEILSDSLHGNYESPAAAIYAIAKTQE